MLKDVQQAEQLNRRCISAAPGQSSVACCRQSRASVACRVGPGGCAPAPHPRPPACGGDPPCRGAGQVQSWGSPAGGTFLDRTQRNVQTPTTCLPISTPCLCKPLDSPVTQAHPPLRHVLGRGAPDERVLELPQQALVDHLAKVLHAGAAAVVAAGTGRHAGPGWQPDYSREGAARLQSVRVASRAKRCPAVARVVRQRQRMRQEQQLLGIDNGLGASAAESHLSTTGSPKSGLCPTFLVYTRTRPFKWGGGRAGACGQAAAARWTAGAEAQAWQRGRPACRAYAHGQAAEVVRREAARLSALLPPWHARSAAAARRDAQQKPLAGSAAQAERWGRALWCAAANTPSSRRRRPC